MCSGSRLLYCTHMGTLREAMDGAPGDQGRSLTPPESQSEPAPWAAPQASERPWEDWSARAIAAGVSPDLVALGTEVIRTSLLQGWGEELRAECGHYDDGEAMVELALSEPTRAAEEWGALLQSDGAD